MNKKNKDSMLEFLVAVAVIIILFFGFFYIGKFMNERNEEKKYYNEFNFYYDENSKLWFTKVELLGVPYIIPFYYHPKELEDIIIEENVEKIILENKPKKIIITVPKDSTAQIALAGIEISKLTGERFQVFKIPTSSAVDEEVEGLPFASCDNSNEDVVVISFKESTNNIIRSEDNCIILEFEENNSIQVADAFAYKLLKIT